MSTGVLNPRLDITWQAFSAEDDTMSEAQEYACGIISVQYGETYGCRRHLYADYKTNSKKSSVSADMVKAYWSIRYIRKT